MTSTPLRLVGAGGKPTPAARSGSTGHAAQGGSTGPAARSGNNVTAARSGSAGTGARTASAGSRVRSGKSERPARSGRPTQEEAQALGQRILEVALDHFFRNGYDGTSTDSIAAAIPVSKRTLYQRFESKRGLLAAVQQWQRSIYQVMAVIPLNGATVRERIAHLSMIILDISLTPSAIDMERLINEVDRLEPGFSDSVREVAITHWRERYHSVLMSDPLLAKESPGTLEFLADYLLGVLVVAPRMRFLTWRTQFETEAAKAAHLERTLDLVARGFPALRRPADVAPDQSDLLQEMCVDEDPATGR